MSKQARNVFLQNLAITTTICQGKNNGCSYIDVVELIVSGLQFDMLSISVPRISSKHILNIYFG